MSRVNLVFTESGQDHEHAGTVYENTQAVKAAVDFTVEPNGTEGTDTFYKIKGSMSHSIYHADRVFYKPAPQLAVSRILCNADAAGIYCS